MSEAEKIAGVIVADEDMHPATNIWGRSWIAGDRHGTYRGHWPTLDGLKPPRLFWIFPAALEKVKGQTDD